MATLGLSRDGYLHKLGFKSGKWQRRYFELRDGLAYASQPGAKSKGRIELRGATVTAVDAGADLSSDALSPGVFAKGPVPMHAFKITCQWAGAGTRSFYLGASDPTDCTNWVAAVQEVAQTVASLPPPAQAAPPAQAPSAPAATAAAGGLGQLGGLMQMAKGLQQPQQGQPAGAAGGLGQLGGLMQMAQGLQQQQKQPQGGAAAGLGQLGGLMQMAQGLQQQQKQQQPQGGAAGGLGQLGGLMQMAQGLQQGQGQGQGQAAGALGQLGGLMKGLNLGGGGAGGAQGAAGGLAGMMGNLMGATSADPQPDPLPVVAAGPAPANAPAAPATQFTLPRLPAPAGGEVSTTRLKQLILAIKELEPHLPADTAGFLVTDAPTNGTLGQQYGFEPYDLIFELEGQRCTKDWTLQEFAAIKTEALRTKGALQAVVYSFRARQCRTITVAASDPAAPLGLTTSIIPHNPAEEAKIDALIESEAASLVVKGWVRTAPNTYVSSTPNAYPLNGPRTAANANVFVKVSRKAGLGYISTNEYHPLFDYTTLAEPLYVEVWTDHGNGTLSQNGGQKFYPLPLTRESA